MKRGEMLTGRSVFRRCQMLGVGCQVWRLVSEIVLLFGLAGLLSLFRFGFGMNAAADIGGQDKSADGVWQMSRTVAREWAGRSGVPESAVVFKLDESALRSVLGNVGKRDGGMEGWRDGEKEGRGVELWLPMPGGGFARFRVVEAPVMKPELAEQFPEIKSYRGWGIDDGRLTMRCDLSPLGFRAMVTDGAELIAIHSVEKNDREHYVSYAGRDYAAAAASALCLVNESKVVRKITPSFSRNSSIGTQIRQYDVAIATTVEYTTANGGQPATMMNLASRVGDLNLIFERELAISLNLVTNSSIVYTNEPDPFTNGTLDTLGQTTGMVDQVRSVLNSQIGAANYDFGLVLGTGTSAGSAYVGVVCETASDSFGPYKGGGAVLVDSSVSIQTNIAMMAHEIGHQFGATHTQNANCGNSTRYGDTAWESGSGLTLMSNAGGCGANNIASARSSYFHSGSFEQIIGYLNFQGASCATLVSNGGNVPPIVTLLNDTNSYVIPKQTPFVLTAAGNDTLGETLTYSWEQIDAGNSGFANPPYTDAGDPPLTTRPIFRPFDPVSSSTRLFPRLQDILSGQNAAAFENLPQVARAMNFRVTVRDNHGGVANDSVRLEVDGNAGPFAVTSPNTTVSLAGGSQQTVSWNKAGTDGNQINCANVNILISADGGQTFSTLLSNTLNDGSQQLTIPNINTTTARIKVEAVGNIFFDISDTNFAIMTCPGITVSPASLANGFVGTTYSQTITASGGVAPYSFSVSAGSLPNGLTLSTGGVLSGNPTTLGVFNFTVMATANNGCQGSRAYTVVISGNGLMFYPLSSPVRLLDTRSGQTACVVTGTPISGGASLTQAASGTCSIPSNAKAVTGNVTVYTPSANGFLTLYPSDAAQPFVANTNYRSGITLENMFTVGLGASDGAFKIYASLTVNVEVDITGYFAPPGANATYFHPLPAPVRLLDTRSGQAACTMPGTPPLANTDTLQQGNGICGIPSTAKALVGNATTVGPTGIGNLILFNAEVARPSITSGNYEAGQTLNSPFLVALSSSGSFKIYTVAQTDLVIDILGYYSLDGTDATSGVGLLYSSLTPQRLLDTRSGATVGCYLPGVPLQNPTEYSQPARGVCTIAPTAKSVIGNATVVGPATNGFLTLWPSDASKPFIATSNFVAGFNFNRFFTVGLGVDGAFKMYAAATTNLVIDVSGYFAP